MRFRVSALIASFLEKPGSSRRELQKKIAKLYDKRSAAAHGQPKHDQQHLLETFNLLRNVLFKIIESGYVPNQEQLDIMFLVQNRNYQLTSLNTAAHKLARLTGVMSQKKRRLFKNLFRTTGLR